MESKQLRRARRLLEEGMCTSCAKPREGEGCTKWLCPRCSKKNREANKRWNRRQQAANYQPRRKKHQLDGNCWCLPKLEVRDGAKIWIHEGGLEHGS